MICRTFSERVELLLDGQVPAAEAESLRSHVTACAACGRELAAADRFRTLLLVEGRDALETEASHRSAEMARRSALDEAKEAAMAKPRTPWMRRLAPFAAAAAVVLALAGGTFFALRDGGGSASWLGAGEAELARFERRDLGPGRSLIVDENARLAASDDGEVVSLLSGAALFQVEKGRPFAVETPQGVARVLGTCFHVRVQASKAVSVAVLSGVVRFEPSGLRPRRVLAAGTSIEISPDGAQRVISPSASADSEMRLSMQAIEIDALRGDLAKRDETIAALRTPKPDASPRAADEGTAKQFDDLPWTEIGRKLRRLLSTRDGMPSEPRALEAMGILFANAEAFTKATGSPRPWDWPLHPAVVERAAPSFVEALAPDVDTDARTAAAAAFAEASRAASAKIAAEVAPAGQIAERMRLLITLIQTTRDRLGAAPSAEIARFLTPERDGAFVRIVDVNDASNADFVTHWGRHFDLTEVQRGALASAAGRLVRETLAVQDEIAAQLGEDEANIIFSPRVHRMRRPPGTLPDAIAIDIAISRLEAKIALAEPRTRFEREIHDILRADQRDRGMPQWGLAAYR